MENSEYMDKSLKLDDTISLFIKKIKNLKKKQNNFNALVPF